MPGDSTTGSALLRDLAAAGDVLAALGCAVIAVAAAVALAFALEKLLRPRK